MTRHTDEHLDDLVRRAVGVDDEEVAAAWSDSEAKTALLQEITAMPTSPPTTDTAPQTVPSPAPWQRVWLVVPAALVAVLALVLVIGPGAFTSDPLRGALAVNQAEGTVTIEVTEAGSDPTGLQQKLRAAGIDVRIETLPAEQSAVGTWLRATFTAEFPSDVANRITEQVGTNRSTITLPADVPGGLTLFVGREAADGEAPRGGPVNLLAEGPLHCLRLDAVSFAEAEQRLRAQGYDVTWQEEYTTSTDDQGRPQTGSGRRLEGLPSEEHRLIAAHFTDADTVMLVVTPVDDPNYDLMRWWGWPDELRSEDPAVRYQDCPAR